MNFLKYCTLIIKLEMNLPKPLLIVKIKLEISEKPKKTRFIPLTRRQHIQGRVRQALLLLECLY
jgi:hypothetical protein